MDKLAILNGLEIVDWSSAFGECEYVLVDANESNRQKIRELGFTDEEITEQFDEGSHTIDISYFAFDHCGAKWFHKQTGFSADPELPKKRLPLPL